MDRRPVIKRGEYFMTRGKNSQIRCKGYTLPPIGARAMDGQYRGTLSPSITFGPVEIYVHGPTFTAVFVNGWWINVWKDRGVVRGFERGQSFATKVPPWIVSQWHEIGWEDEYLCDFIGVGGADDGAG